MLVNKGSPVTEKACLGSPGAVLVTGPVARWGRLQGWLSNHRST